MKQDQMHSYLALRKAVGWIGILLPFALMTGVFVFFDGTSILETISQYYYSGMRDVFVGAICAIALFLFFYKGYDKWDNIAGNVAGFSALGVALFPTTESGPTDWAGTIHFACATVFFLVLAFFSMFLFTKTKKGSKPTGRKAIRNRIYYICGIIMISCLILIAVYYSFFYDEASSTCFVFWAETAALVAFGISWLTKGGSLCHDA